jgi:hypothetical protein
VKRLPVFDIISFLLLVGIAANMAYITRRLNRVERAALGSADLLDDAQFLPMEAYDSSGAAIRVSYRKPSAVLLYVDQLRQLSTLDARLGLDRQNTWTRQGSVPDT